MFVPALSSDIFILYRQISKNRSINNIAMKQPKLTIPAMAALLVAALAACSGDDDLQVEFEVSPLEKEYTLSVETAKGIGVVVGDLQSQTRALTQSGSTLNASWATTDRVYVQKGGTWATGSLQPQTAGATATLKGSLTGVTIAVDDVLTLQFPKSGTPDYSGQKGTLEDIAANYDYATATATVWAVSANGMVAADAATFTNQQAILKFSLMNSGGTAISASALSVQVDGTPYAVVPASAASEIYVAVPGFSSKKVELFAKVGNNWYSYEKTGITFANGQYYTIAVKMSQTGTLPGKFSVGESSTVRFSQGNLQATYNGSAWSWAFAANQYDYIGNATANTAITGDGTVSTNGTVDLFGWSTSSTTYGIHNSTNYSTYSGDFRDWGVNAISNGGNEANAYSTPSTSHWQYLFNTRSASTVCGTANARFAKAYLFGTKHGVILFPDHYTHPDGVAAPTGINDTSNTSWNDNQYSAADWAKMEAAGAVFLPAAGGRYGSGVYLVGDYGYYWSSTANSGDYAWGVLFVNDNLLAGNGLYRGSGYSVRLVRNAN